MKELEEFTDSTAVAAWSPADTYADLIMEAVACYGDLQGVVTQAEYDLQAGEGNEIQVRYAPARTAQGPFTFAETNCLSDTSSTLGTYGITLRRYGDYDIMKGYSLFEAGPRVKDAILNEMAKGLAVAQDARIWDALAASAGYRYYSAVSCGSTEVSTTTCCDYKYNFYNSVVSVIKYMQGQAYNPDYVIMHPTVAKYLYWADHKSPPGGLVTYTPDGKLADIAGCKVIESCAANDCGEEVAGNETSTMCIIIDSSRAVGEVWGKRPTFSEHYEEYCDEYREVIWMYWYAERMDQSAIAHIMNPA